MLMTDAQFYDAFIARLAEFPTEPLARAQLYHRAARELSAKLASGAITRDTHCDESGIDLVYTLDTTATHILHDAHIPFSVLTPAP